VGPRHSLAAAGALAVLMLPAAAARAAGPILQNAPSVIGTAAAGKLLTGLSGSWGGTGTITYLFQWYRCNAAGGSCTVIHAATSPTYALDARDVGKTLGLAVRATDSNGTSSAYSSLVGPIAPKRPLLESTAQPVVTGPPIEGKTVQVTTGTWSPTPAQLAYRWERCNVHGRACAAIPGATAASYTITAADVGHALLAIVQGTNGSTIQNAFSTTTPPVVDGTLRGPRSTLAPTLSGPAVVGQQLTATPGIWKGVGPIVFAYHWYSCDGSGGHCTLIRTSDGTAYTSAAGDVGRTIGLTLRVSDSTGAISAYTALVGPVAPADAALTPTTAPTISGTARVGGTLTADPGVWTPSPAAFTYSWLRCNPNGRLCAPIPAATRASYRPTPDDRGHALVASVLARVGSATQAALSAATSPVT